MATLVIRKAPFRLQCQYTSEGKGALRGRATGSVRLGCDNSVGPRIWSAARIAAFLFFFSFFSSEENEEKCQSGDPRRTPNPPRFPNLRPSLRRCIQETSCIHPRRGVSLHTL